MNLFDAPPAFLHIKNWLGPEHVARFLSYALDRKNEFRPSGLNTPTGPRVDLTRRISEKLAPIPEIACVIEARVDAALADIFRALAATPFTPTSYETELVAHGDGAFLRRHRDMQPGMQRGRFLSGVYYFHREPKAFSGGQLRLHALSENLKPGTFADIEPENDSMVFFSSWFPHEVLPVSCPSKEFKDSRFAINCWIRY